METDKNVPDLPKPSYPQPKWAPCITTGVLGICMAFTPLVGNAILRHRNSSFATNDTVALRNLGLIGASIFAATGFTVGRSLWARYVDCGPWPYTDGGDRPGTGLAKEFSAFVISPFLYVGAGVVASAISWGVLRGSGYAGNIALAKAVIASAVGSSVLGGSLWIVSAVLGAGILYVGAKGYKFCTE